MKEFVKTEKINLLENEIECLRKELIDKDKELKKEIQTEFEKQNNLKMEKTILKYEEDEYLYAGFEEIGMLWVKGFSFKKNGEVSLRLKTLYNDWEHTGKEYNINESK